jgi:hypothetical protein
MESHHPQMHPKSASSTNETACLPAKCSWFCILCQRIPGDSRGKDPSIGHEERVCSGEDGLEVEPRPGIRQGKQKGQMLSTIANRCQLVFTGMFHECLVFAIGFETSIAPWN